MTANTPATRKAKGRSFQQLVREKVINALGIHEKDIQSTAMGQSGADIYLSASARNIFPFAVECKHQDNISIHSWWEQCTVNALKEKLNPLLVFKRKRNGKVGSDILCVIEFEYLLDILVENQRFREGEVKR